MQRAREREARGREARENNGGHVWGGGHERGEVDASKDAGRRAQGWVWFDEGRGGWLEAEGALLATFASALILTVVVSSVFGVTAPGSRGLGFVCE